MEQSGAVSEVPPPRGTPPPELASARCNVNYFNSRFAYGFDLPIGAQVFRMSENPTYLFDADWVQIIGSARLGFITTVYANIFDDSTTSLAIGLNQSARNSGAVFIVEEPFTLSDGGPAYFSQYINIGIVNYRVDAVRNSIAYSLLAVVDEDSQLPVSHPISAWLST